MLDTLEILELSIYSNKSNLEKENNYLKVLKINNGGHPFLRIDMSKIIRYYPNLIEFGGYLDNEIINLIINKKLIIKLDINNKEEIDLRIFINLQELIVENPLKMNLIVNNNVIIKKSSKR